MRFGSGYLEEMMSDNNYIIQKLTGDSLFYWDDFVDSSPQGTIFHKSYWIQTSATASKTPMEIIAVLDKNENIIAGLPVFFKRKYGLPYSISNLALSPSGGFLLSPQSSKNVRENEQKDKLCLTFLSQYIINKKAFLNLVYNYPNFIDLRPLIREGWKSKLNYTYILMLEDLWNNISKKTRNIIRKAERENIEVIVEYNPEIYWDLIKDTYKKQNQTVPFTKEYITSLMDVAIEHNSGEMWLAKMPNGDVASAEFILWDNKMVHRWSAASNTEYKNTGATSLLLYKIFIEMQNRGHSKMNLMAANTPHLTKFVSGFNPTLTPDYICIYSPLLKRFKII